MIIDALCRIVRIRPCLDSIESDCLFLQNHWSQSILDTETLRLGEISRERVVLDREHSKTSDLLPEGNNPPTATHNVGLGAAAIPAPECVEFACLDNLDKYCVFWIEKFCFSMEKPQVLHTPIQPGVHLPCMNNKLTAINHIVDSGSDSLVFDAMEEHSSHTRWMIAVTAMTTTWHSSYCTTYVVPSRSIGEGKKQKVGPHIQP